MAITSIKRDIVADPAIVHIVTTDALSVITTADYWSTQSDEVIALQHGEFIFQSGEVCLIDYSDGEGFFTYDATNDTFVAETDPGSLSATLLSANIFVGSAANVATGVALTGDIAISNTGVSSIAAGVIVNADVNAAAAIAFSKLATLASGNVLVGSAGGVATSVALSGDVTTSNAGVTAIGAAKVLSSMMSPLLLRYVTVAISAAAFNGMHVTPVQLVAAGGANTLLVIDSVDVLMTYNSAQFANGGVAHIQYGNTTLGAGIIASSTQAAANFFDAASTALHFNAGIVKQPFTTAVNLGLFLSNVSAAFDTGNSTFIVHVRYYQLPTV